MKVYIIATEDQALCYSSSGWECLKAMPKTRSAPGSVMIFPEKERAESYLTFLKDSGCWYLFTQEALVKEIEVQ